MCVCVCKHMCEWVFVTYVYVCVVLKSIRVCECAVFKFA